MEANGLTIKKYGKPKRSYIINEYYFNTELQKKIVTV